jgi:hypothetical protein
MEVGKKKVRQRDDGDSSYATEFAYDLLEPHIRKHDSSATLM